MTDGERMFRLEITLGAIIELCEVSSRYSITGLAISTAVKAICRIHGLKPHELHQKYKAWQESRDYEEGERSE